MKNILIIFAFLVSTQILYSADVESTHVEVILDASNSMNEIINNEKKLVTAKRVLSNLVQQWEEESQGNILIGLRIYGNHFDPYGTKDKACQDTTLEVPISNNTANTIKSKIHEVQAKGYTPIAYTLEQAKVDFDPAHNNVVVLVSDGKESCGGDPCQVARSYKLQGIDLKMHVIGFSVDEATKLQLKCISDATGGQYYAAENANDLKLVAEQVKMLVSESIAKPKAVKNVRKVKFAGPGKIHFQLVEGVEPRFQYIHVHKAGTDEVVIKMWQEFNIPKVLSSGKYDVYIQYKGSTGWVPYAKDVEILSKEKTVVALNTGIQFLIEDEETLKGISAIHIHSLPDEVLITKTWDQKYLTTPKILAPGKYRIYFSYKGSRDPTLVIDEIEISQGEILEIDI